MRFVPLQIEKGFAMRYLFPCECEIDSETGRYVLSSSSPSAVAEGNTLQKAKEEMQDLLLLILGDCIRFHEKFPEPAPLSGKGKEEVVTFSHLQTLKVQLINAMVEKNWRPVELSTYSDNNKALASTPREILGEFMKSRLEANTSLRRGDTITEDILAEYGRNSVTLTKLSNGEYVLTF